MTAFAISKAGENPVSYSPKYQAWHVKADGRIIGDLKWNRRSNAWQVRITDSIYLQAHGVHGVAWSCEHPDKTKALLMFKETLGFKPLDTQSINRWFLNLFSTLSPENISWDGERPQAEVVKHRKLLLEEKTIMEVIIGYTIDEQTIYNWYDRQAHNGFPIN